MRGRELKFQRGNTSFYLILIQPSFSFKDFEFKSSKHFWIGGTDLGEEGKFFFVGNGRAVGNLLWSRNEPNNLKKSDGSETENCMAYVHSDGLKVYRLFDKFCSLKLHFICQESLTTDPCAGIAPRFGSQ